MFFSAHSWKKFQNPRTLEQIPESRALLIPLRTQMSKRPPGSPKNYSKRQRRDYSPRRRSEAPRPRVPASEMKYFDAEATLLAIPVLTTTWVATTMADPETTINLGDPAIATPLCLCAPKVSASLNGRIGRSILIHKVKVRGHIVVNTQAAQAATDPSSYIRLMLVQDTQTNAAQMTGAQLMNDGSAADATINSFQNPNNFGRFRVLKDKTIVIGNPGGFNDGAATGATNGLVRPFKMVVNFKTPVKVQFNATNGGTVADIVDNSFHIVVGANTISLAPTLSYYSRVAYKE